MGEPLAVAIPVARAEAPGGDLGEPRAEAAVPGPAHHRRRPGQVGRLCRGGAEAGRAGERAVPAQDAALGDLEPARRVELGEEPVVEAVGRDRVADPRTNGRDRRRRAVLLDGSRRTEGQPLDDRPAGGRAGIDEEAIIELGEGNVVPGLDLRPGAHRGAEAGGGSGRALDGDDEHVRPPGEVVGVDERPGREDPVLHAEGRQLAGPDAEEGEPGLGRAGPDRT